MSSHASGLLDDRAARHTPSPVAGPETESGMPDPDDPDLMTPEERTREIASILATGYLRIHDLRAPETAPRGGLSGGGDMSHEAKKALDSAGNHSAL